MPVLPVPMIIALLLFGLLLQRLLTRETHLTLLALIAACAVQSAIIACVQYYGLVALRPVQPLFAMLIPPIAWLAFSQASGGNIQSPRTWLHASGFVVAVLSYIIQPMLLDVLIPLSFAGYGAAMLVRLLRGEASLPHSRLESGTLPLMAWTVVALSLIASSLCDVAIAYAFASGQQGILWLPSLVSSLSLLSLGILSLSNAMESQRDADGDEASLSEEDAERDLAIIAKLDSYVQSQKPYLDPDLTLARLARKLLLPAKQLSAAINRVKGENVSRYINRLRIEDACQRMSRGQSVTAAMLESGFNTKSNFNREFLRIKNRPPRQWLAEAARGL